MMLTCRKDSGVTKPADFKGKTLGVWFSGNEYPFLSWMDKLGYSTSGGNPDIKVLKQGFNVDPLLQKQAACISTMTYNEYWQVIDAGISPSPNWSSSSTRTRASRRWRTGSTPLDAKLKDPKMVDKLARFVEGVDEGLGLRRQEPGRGGRRSCWTTTPSGAQTEKHQKQMISEIAKLIEGGAKPGYLDPAAYERTVGVLINGKSDPVISKKPEGAWTHEVWEKAGL